VAALSDFACAAAHAAAFNAGLKVSDPTGTAALRRAFLAEGNRRLARVRSLTHSMLVEHDLMQTRSEPVAQFLPHPGHRLPVFADWFSRTVNMQLLGDRWWERYLARAYDSGLAAGSELVKGNGIPPSRSSLPAVYRESASQELAGIAAALVQHVSRQAGGAALGKQKPQLLYRAVLGAIRRVGAARLKAFVNVMVVKLHNAARLEHFRAAGITQVGIVPEHRELAKPSRFLKHDHAVVHDRSAAQTLASVTSAALRLLARQRRAREEELAQRQSELEAEQRRMEREIAAHLAGAPLRSGTLAQAQAALAAAQARAEEEVATAKAATAAQEAEARAAWEKVLAARKEARAAEYAATRAAKPKAEEAKTAAVEAQAKSVETEAKVAQLVPARLLAIGAQYVNVLTAGDDLVCQICEDISEEGPYSLDEAQGLIPAHPNCRCAFVPAITSAQVAEAA
jgi:hypothetical protein